MVAPSQLGSREPEPVGTNAARLARVRPRSLRALSTSPDSGNLHHAASKARRPVFHSEADFQHALAWTIQTEHPDARIRLETRPERGIHLDMLVVHHGVRCAIELKYLGHVLATLDERPVRLA